MADINRGSGNLEANALVTVACASLAMLQDKLEGVASQQPSAVHLLIQWWPVLLIIAGLIVLFANWNARGDGRVFRTPESRPPVSQEQRELTHER